jgi:hypothetical protein
MTQQLPSADELSANYEALIKQEVQSMPAQYFSVQRKKPENQIVAESRERVFCYELYHQLRIKIESPEQTLELAKDIIQLHGELSKGLYSSYPNITLDFIIHQPTKTDYNLIAVEVKSNFDSFERKGKPDGIYKDFISLCHMLNNGYKLGIFVLFGKTYQAFLDTWVKNQSKMAGNYEMFKYFGDRIKILVKESAGLESELVEKTLSKFLKDVKEKGIVDEAVEDED